MKEVVLPSTGEFARFESVKFSDMLACASAPNLGVALIERLVTIDGRKVDLAFLDAMPMADAMVIWNVIHDECKPVFTAKGVS